MSTKTKLNLIRVYLILTLLNCLLTVSMLIITPNRVAEPFTKISLNNLFLILPTLVISVMLVWLLRNTRNQPRRAIHWIKKTDTLFHKDRFYWLILGLSASALFTFTLIIQVAGWVTNLQLKPFIQYTLPYIISFAIQCMLTIIFARLMRYGLEIEVFKPYKGMLRATGVVILLLACIVSFVLITGIGLTPDPAMWGDPGTPTLETQIITSFALTLGIYAALYLTACIVEKKRHRKLNIPDWIKTLSLSFLIWFLAFYLWSIEPLGRNYFTPDPLPPNYEVYPHSDAATYEIGAQNLLIGKSPNEELVRPLYSTFLAMAQYFNGIGYENILAWQIPIFALMPALVFVLVQRLHHTLSGLLVSLLVIFQQTNALALSGVINVSHIKLLMSDFPTTLILVALTLSGVIWLSNRKVRTSFAVLTAGILALAMLVRVQSGFVALAILGVILLLGVRSQRKQWLFQAAIFIVSLIIFVSPWMLRNWRLTGQFGFSQLGSGSHAQIEVLGMRYSQTPGEEGGSRLEGESQSEFLSRMINNAVTYALDNPLETAQFITAHLIHNEISTIFVLPVQYNLAQNLQEFISRLPYWSNKPIKLWEWCCSLSNYVEDLPYWDFWDGTILTTSHIPLITTLVLIAIGLGTTWARFKWIGFLPLFVNLSYSLGNAVARNSGWRFNMPVDWVGILYFGIGILQVCFWIATFFTNRIVPKVLTQNLTIDKQKIKQFSFDWRRITIFSSVILLLVTSIPILELVVKDRYAGESVKSVLYKLDQEGSLSLVGLQMSTIEEFLQLEGSVSGIGRALYPRHFQAGEGLPGSGWDGLSPMDTSRMTFVFTGTSPNQVILPLDEPPEYFPNASDVLIVGCLREGYVEASVLAIYGEEKSTILRSPIFIKTCN